jgi:hypothetical protein
MKKVSLHSTFHEGSGIRVNKWSDLDPDPGSGIKHPGSATLIWRSKMNGQYEAVLRSRLVLTRVQLWLREGE